MKKRNKVMASIIAATILTFSAFTSLSAYAQKEEPALSSSSVKISINGASVPAPEYTHVVNGQVMLPIRWASEKLSETSIEWNSKTSTVSIKTNQTFNKLQKLSSYYHGLSKEPESRKSEVCPMPEGTKELTFPKMPKTRALNTNNAPAKSMITISINDTPFAVYDYEFCGNRIYISSDWIEELLDVSVDFDSKSNQLSINSLNEKDIDTLIQKIEDALTPASPEEALKLWGRGEQLRSGALQYAALSPELRKKAEDQMLAANQYWVTGGSSPWVGAITIKGQKKISETSIEFTVGYPEVTSAGSAPATEKLVVEKLTVNGKQGWYITKLLIADPYFTIIPPETEFTANFQ